MPDLYIIAGCNGAGKTTASYTILPEMLNCQEFINADNIAAQLSPGDPETAALQAGRIMLTKIKDLVSKGQTFAFETTLSSKTYLPFIQDAKLKGYNISLIFFWLDSPEAAKLRVKERVAHGGHNIPVDVIERRYKRGLENFFFMYAPISHVWILVNNSLRETEVIAKGELNQVSEIKNSDIWDTIKKQTNGLTTEKRRGIR